MEDLLIQPMPIHPTGFDILMRLGATILAAGLMGLNRERGGHAAGFRTTILVGIAACLSMIEGNILLTTPIEGMNSGVRIDALRLALGTLTGVGFIGAGAIMHKGDLVTGVTTAATLWVITAIGICFGGGQLALGALATCLAFIVLSPMRYITSNVSRKEKAVVTLRQDISAPLPSLEAALEGMKTSVRFLSRKRSGSDEDAVLLAYEIGWWQKPNSGKPGDLIAALENRFQVISIDIANAEL